MTARSFLVAAAALLAAQPLAASAARATAPVQNGDSDKIRLVFLGTGAPRPSEERHGASILVEAGKHRVLIDCGPEIRQRIFQAGNFDLLTNITEIFVTHLHYDHIADIDDVWIAGWMYGRRTPLTIWGPPGTEKFASDISSAFSWDIRYREIVGIPAAGNRLQAHDLKPGEVFDRDGLKITAFHVEHMPINPATMKVGKLEGDTYGYKVEYKGRSVVFSGDVRDLPNSEIVKAAQGADVLVHEVQVPSTGGDKEAERANVSLNVHTTPEQAGAVFAKAKPRMAVYSHIIPPQTTGEYLSALTRPYYKGPLVSAFDLMTLTVGEQIEVGRRENQASRVFEDTSAVQK
ncbi:MBL fold metallo-hydrolase [Novosphingobium sp. RD2P27]|uniref:MBL fold metallo-hydrolase n=1 Tax=Novosphingobium kalidii TaxID=3230299 RepID=A0ABV2D316_9SPHN